MASNRRDDLAKRLAERLDKAPDRGKAMRAGSRRSSSTDQPADGAATATAPPETRAPETRPRRRTTPTTAQPADTTTEEQSTRRRPSAGQATPKREVSDRAAPPVRPATARSGPASRPRRGSPDTVLRGHLVPDPIHRDAKRRKAALRSQRGGRITWDDVMCEGVSLLIDRRAGIGAQLDQLDRRDDGTSRRRLVQATLPSDLDDELVTLHLDLAERSGIEATYERLWASAIILWLDATS